MKNGIEIFFQNLGDADSIFVRTWKNDLPTNILIDGGYKKDYAQVKKFLTERLKETNSPQIDHLVCTHCHDDHAGGLVELADECDFLIGNAWVHDTRNGIEVLTESRKSLIKQAGAFKVLEKILESEARRHELLHALETKHPNTVVHEPKVGDKIGPLVILSPTDDFFRQQLFKLDNVEAIRNLEESINQNIMSFSQFFEAKSASEDKPLGGFVGPINETSLVTAYFHNLEGQEDVFLFTADAGCDAFNNILTYLPTQLQGVKWMQIPHHGSRRNLDEALISHFAPRTSMISASGSVKHPRLKLVNKLKNHGKVYSTHYSVNSGGWLRQTAGIVFEMETVPATALYEKP